MAEELEVGFYPADLTRPEDVSNLARHLQERYGRIDIAFNNAGIAHAVPAEECSDEQWLRVIISI